MDYKHFVLGYYKNASDGIHIQRVIHANEAKKMHSHEYFQIYYLEKGSLIHHIADSSAKLVAGDMFIIPPGVTHRISDNEGCVFYSLSFMSGALSPLTTDSLAVGFLNTLKTQNNIRLKVSLPSEEALRVENLIVQIYKEFENKKIGFGEIIKAYITVLISLFARVYFESAPTVITADDGKQFIFHCIDYIDNYYYQSISLENVLQLSAMSKTKFCKSFFDATGCSFHQYLNRCRIRKAVEYIEKGYKITAVYGLCGYNDFSTFYRNFVKVMGVSPTAYRSLEEK